jgi:hypothetical protein
VLLNVVGLGLSLSSIFLAVVGWFSFLASFGIVLGMGVVL